MALADVRRLRALALVLDLGSVSAAATVLGYTQSAVSQQVAALEQEFGSPLVDRASRPFRPTPAGEALRPYLDRLLAAAADAEAAAEDLRRPQPRRLRLAAFSSALSTFVPRAVRELRRAERDLVVQVLELETREAVERVQRGGADLAVVYHVPGIAAPGAGDLERHHLVVDELHVVVPAGHRLASRATVALEELDGEPLVVPRRDTPAGRFRAVLERLFAEHGATPRVAYEIDDLRAAQSFAAAGIAVVVMHGLTAAEPPAGVAVRPLAEPEAGRVIDVVLPTGPRAAAVDALLGHLVAAATGGARDPLRGAPR
jgi:DNA-binding transcriptional LysR family regulator